MICDDRIPAFSWVPLVALPAASLAIQPHLPPWGFMWAMLLGLMAGCKWLTWSQAIQCAGAPPLGRSLGYLLAWPGMAAEPFLSGERPVRRPGRNQWLLALSKTLFGVSLLWGAARLVPESQPYLAGWVGMIGMAWLVQFGSFHLLALGWQSVGVDARPIFRAPVWARSLGDFWGSRWNLAFRELAYRNVFRPLATRLGTGGASLMTFVVSGLVHELVISVPAGACYGLPTAYFLVQWLGVLVERSAWGRGIGLGRGFGGWLFALLVTAGPACLLFHPPFVHRVVLPFLQVIGCR